MRNSLPDFVAFGPPKTATTSLYWYLRQHPHLYLPDNKEIGFFAFEGMQEVLFPEEHLATNLDAYRAIFEGASSDQLRGEVSSLYVISERAPRRMAEVLPHAKLIVTLRNPADRAYSEYLMNVGNGTETRDLAAAVMEEPHTDLHYAANHYLESRIVRNGFYYAHLSRYYALFPAEHIHVIMFEQLVRDPQSVLKEIFSFLDVDATIGINTSTAHNQARVPRSWLLHRLLIHRNVPREVVKAILPIQVRHSIRDLILRVNMHRPPSQLTDTLRERLVALYRDDILKLETLIHRDLSYWLKVPER